MSAHPQTLCSERISISGAEGERLVETQNINLSLSVLGDVLSALSRNATAMSQSTRTDSSLKPILKPVPYRNSKLTFLLKVRVDGTPAVFMLCVALLSLEYELQDSLGGNSKTVMITTLRPTMAYYQQSMISLMYASRAKNIRNRAVLNKETVGDAAISQWSEEIDRLRSRLDQRATEFDELLERQTHESQENKALRYRLQVHMTHARNFDQCAFLYLGFIIFSVAFFLISI